MSNMAQDLRYLGAQIEETNSNVRLILETLIPMKEQVDKISRIEDDISEIKNDIRTIKHALKDTNKQVTDHEHRITKLGSKVA